MCLVEREVAGPSYFTCRFGIQFPIFWSKIIYPYYIELNRIKLESTATSCRLTVKRSDFTIRGQTEVEVAKHTDCVLMLETPSVNVK